MFLQRCFIILSIFVCYAYTRGGNINCEKYPFHSQCRGIQTKKRYMIVEDDAFGEPDCSSKAKLFSKQQQTNPDHVNYNAIPKSRLWAALLDNGLNTDALYEAYVSASEKQKNRRNDNNKPNNRRISLQDFSSELDMLDGDY